MDQNSQHHQKQTDAREGVTTKRPRNFDEMDEQHVRVLDRLFVEAFAAHDARKRRQQKLETDKQSVDKVV